jgi:hypothetical protein
MKDSDKSEFAALSRDIKKERKALSPAANFKCENDSARRLLN